MQQRYEARLVSAISNCWSVWDRHTNDWRSPTVTWTGADAESKCKRFVELHNLQSAATQHPLRASETILYSFTDADRDDPTRFFQFMSAVLGNE